VVFEEDITNCGDGSGFPTGGGPGEPGNLGAAQYTFSASANFHWLDYTFDELMGFVDQGEIALTDINFLGTSSQGLGRSGRLMNARRKGHVHRLWLIIALCNSAPVAAAQATQADRSQFINFPDPPLVLDEFGKTSQVRNISSKTVVRFALACIVSRGTRSTAVLKFSAHEPTSPPGYIGPEIISDGSTSLSVKVSRKAKLTNVDISFSDGSRWFAPVRQAPSKSDKHE